MYLMPTSFYIKKYKKAQKDQNDTSLTNDQLKKAYCCRVSAIWALISKGEKSIPFALELLHSKSQEEKEDAAGILGELGKNDDVIDSLIMQLDAKCTVQVKDTIIIALGNLKSKKALKKLKQMLLDPEMDGDSKYTAAESVGKIIKCNILKKDDPITYAIDWLNSNV